MDFGDGNIDYVDCKNLTYNYTDGLESHKIKIYDAITLGFNAFRINYGNVKNIILSKTITKIDESAFQDNDFENIIIPDNVTELEPYAFQNSSVKNVIFSKNINKIPERCFSGCSNLVEIIIPDTIVEIGEHAFSYSSLENINIPNSEKTVLHQRK